MFRRNFFAAMIMTAMIAFSTSVLMAEDAYLNRMFDEARAAQNETNYRDATRKFMNCLDYARKKHGRDDQAIAYIRCELGKCAYKLNRLTDAVEHFKVALGVAQRHEMWDEQVRVLSEMAQVYTLLGKSNQSRQLLENAISICNQKLPKAELTSLYANLAILAYYENEDHTTIQLLNKAESLARTFNQPVFLSYVYYWKGRIAERQSKFDEALRFHREALRLRNTHESSNKQAISWSHIALGRLAQHRGEWELAQTYFSEARKLMIQVGGLQNKDVGEINLHLAEVFAERGDWESSLKFAREARQNQIRFASTTLNSLSEPQKLKFLKLEETTYGFFNRTLQLMLNAPDRQSHLQETLGWLLNSKGLANEVLATSASKGNWVTSQHVASKLDSNSVLIEIARVEYQSTPDLYVAYLLFPSGRVERIVLGSALKLDRAISKSRKCIQEYGAELRFEIAEADAERLAQQPLREISTILWAPISRHLHGVKQLVISPDHATWLVPWTTLLSKDDRYLIEDYEISFAISGRMLTKNVKLASQSQSVCFAGPNYDLAPQFQPIRSGNGRRARLDFRWEPLNFAAQEIAKLVPWQRGYLGTSPRVFTGDRALESEVKRLVNPKTLYLSTHGFSQQTLLESNASADTGGPGVNPDENPLLQCGLAFAGANNATKLVQQQKDDGILNGMEISRLRLTGTELVVLSACDTIEGKFHQGEGLLGLQQSFRLAGAQQILATLWSIPEQESSQVMESFWANMAQGKSASRALRNAQLAIIKEHRQENEAAHPYHWAAFTITGHGTKK